MLKEKILINREQDKYINVGFSSNIDTTQLNEIQNLIDREKNLFINLTPDEEVLNFNTETEINNNLNILFYNNETSGYTNSFLFTRLNFSIIDILVDSQGIRKSFFYFPLYDINNVNKETLVGFGFLKLTKDNIISSNGNTIPISDQNFSFYIKKKGLALDQDIFYFKLQFFNARTGERSDFSSNQSGVVSGNTEYYSITLDKNNYSYSFNDTLTFYEIYNDFITEDSLDNRDDQEYDIDELDDTFVKTVEGKLSGDTIEILEDKFLEGFNREKRTAVLRLAFPVSGGTFSMVVTGDKVEGIYNTTDGVDTLRYSFGYFDSVNGVNLSSEDTVSFVKFGGGTFSSAFTFLKREIIIDGIDLNELYTIVTVLIIEENDDITRKMDISDNDILANSEIETYPTVFFNGNESLTEIRAENNINLNNISLSSTFYNILDFTNCRLNYFDISENENTFNTLFGGYYNFHNNNFTTEEIDLFLENLDNVAVNSDFFINRFIDLYSSNYSGTTTNVTGTTFINSLVNDKDFTLVLNQGTYSNSTDHIKLTKASNWIATKDYQNKYQNTFDIRFNTTSPGKFKIGDSFLDYIPYTSHGSGDFTYNDIYTFAESDNNLTYLTPFKIYFQDNSNTSAGMNNIQELTIKNQGLVSLFDISGLSNINELNVEDNKINTLILPTGNTMTLIKAKNNNISYVNFEHTNVFNVNSANYIFENNYLKSLEVNNMLISLSKGANSGFVNRVFYIFGNNDEPTLYDTTVSGYTETTLSNTTTTLPVKPSSTQSDENWFWNPNTSLHEPKTGGAAIRDLLTKNVQVRTKNNTFS